MQSLASSFLSLSLETRKSRLARLSDREAAALPFAWDFFARPNQVEPPGDWRVWLVLAGRGFGKTRMGAEWIRKRAESGHYRRFALIGQTSADVRDVMIEGESGILAISPPWFRPEYEPSKRRLTWPNGAIATTYSGDSPDQLRGPQHDSAWADEPAKWKYGVAAWDNMEFGLRIGPKPQVVATTTPRPIVLIKSLIADPQTVTTRGSTYDNLANLAPSFAKRILAKYEGTRIGRQELNAEMLDDTPGALWTRMLLENTRLTSTPDLLRVVVAIDPQASSGQTGIIVAGKGKVGDESHGYTLDDATPPEGVSPAVWATAAVAAYNKWHADCIVAEVNNGGDMIENVIRNVPGGKSIRYKTIRATRGKYTRAEPIAAIFEQGRGHHVGYFAELEDQQCTWVPGDESPDRLDAEVWAYTELMIEITGAGLV
jgi:phage terminase large subunit-like protein